MMKIDEATAFEVLGYLEVIRTSLAKIGRQYADDEDAFARAICYFAIDYELYTKLTFANKFMDNLLEGEGKGNEVEKFYDALEYWKIPVHITANDLKSKIKERLA